MFSNRIKYAIDNFIAEGYFVNNSAVYLLKETEDTGKSELNVKVNGINICVENYDKKKRCSFLREQKKFGMQKCIDHFLLLKQTDQWELHMIEMKKSVGSETWISIKQKMRASYLNIKALAVFLGIYIDDFKVVTYTTYEKDCFNNAVDTPNPKMLVPPLGERAIDYRKEEWDGGKMKLKLADEVILEFTHIPIKMNLSSDGTTLQGTLHI